MRKIRKIVSRGIGLVVSGPKGAGKTSIACMAAVEVARYGVETRFILAADAVKLMKSFNREPLEDIIRRIHVLVIDDVTEKVIDAPELETLIRDRTSNDLSTFITTNLALDVFKQKNAMLWDLIAENCLPIEVDNRARMRGLAQMPEDD
jgi:DNA replication protein DnaC